jgi:lipopolysaccharide transport system ATP-binding protein
MVVPAVEPVAGSGQNWLKGIEVIETMSAVIILDKVSKRFSLQQQKPRSFLEAATQVFRHSATVQEEPFWALKDVSFEVSPGETLGIIGSNGVGKSSLLKLIARILEPTSGQITVQGKVGALLELGVGFHPDLTGRENIYLYGAIMGVSRGEINHRLNAIIDFSGLERFIDMPVRHYSSGMYVRLGFSVAINADPEILLVDEVLAVGDQSFQAKCLAKIAQLQQAGTTVVLVSHDLAAVRNLCRRAIWLDAGRIQADGATEWVLNEYLQHVWQREGKEQSVVEQGQRWGSGEVVIEKVEFLDAAGEHTTTFNTEERFVARIWYWARQAISLPAFGVAIYGEDGVHITGPNTVLSGYPIERIEGEGCVDYIVEELPLLVGKYEFTAAVYDHYSLRPYDHRQRQFTFEVVPSMISQREGMFFVPCRWNHQVIGE